jgi:hypothetical protein
MSFNKSLANNAHLRLLTRCAKQAKRSFAHRLTATVQRNFSKNLTLRYFFKKLHKAVSRYAQCYGDHATNKLTA